MYIVCGVCVVWVERVQCVRSVCGGRVGCAECGQ